MKSIITFYSTSPIEFYICSSTVLDVDSIETMYKSSGRNKKWL